MTPPSLRHCDVGFLWLCSGKPLDEHAAHVLGVMRSYFLEEGTPPTTHDVAARLKTTNLDSVAVTIRKLVRLGYVRGGRGRKARDRELTLVTKGVVRS